MAQKVSEPSRTVTTTTPHMNGTAQTPRVGEPVKRGSGTGLISLVFGLLLLAAVAAGAYYFYFKPKPEAAGTEATATDSASAGKSGKHGGKHGADTIRVVTATAAKGDIGVYLVGLGAVTPLNTVLIRTRVDGQLMKVNFTEGQTVKKGDHLVKIDDRPYQAQLEQFKAQKEHDEALLDNAKIDEQRYETLWKQDSIPQQTLATQQALVKQDQGTVDSDQAQIDQTALNILYCDITAPVTGRVGLRLVDEGNQVHAADSTGLLVVNQVQPITVVFTIAEDNVPDVMSKLTAGQTLPVLAFDRLGKKQLSIGSLLTTDNQIDPSTGTLKLKATFDNKDNALFPNQFVNARLLLEMKKDVILIPTAAIQYGAQNSTFVYVVNNTDPKNVTVTMKNIVVGTAGLPNSPDAGKSEIVSGVEENEIVVTDGVDKLQNGSKVLLAEPDGGGSNGKGGHKHGGAAATADASSS